MTDSYYYSDDLTLWKMRTEDGSLAAGSMRTEDPGKMSSPNENEPLVWLCLCAASLILLTAAVWKKHYPGQRR